jgi:glyoxylase-like metal-dependent hydrolase (beta-lactamase superfamily II)
MSTIRQPGKINEDTTLIDIGMNGIYGIAAVYLVRGARTCLIDGGTRTEAPRLLKALRELDALPPDLIITTHPHWDHTQAIPSLRQEAVREGKAMEVMASHEAIPLLADASFNEVLGDLFGQGPYESIRDVTPIKEGDTIDLGGVTLRIYEVPGHCRGHLAVLDERNRNFFVGDAIGLKLPDTIFVPPFTPPCWDPGAFLSSVNKLRQVSYETLCLAHFGFICGSEARSILDEAVETYHTWWQWYERHADRLSDTEYLLQAMREEINPGIPSIKPTSSASSIKLGLLTALGTITGRKTAILDRLAFRDPLRCLGIGYMLSTSSSTGRCDP